MRLQSTDIDTKSTKPTESTNPTYLQLICKFFKGIKAENPEALKLA